jgi:glycine/D-amino acid oxidase-like deaminating enzyme
MPNVPVWEDVDRQPLPVLYGDTSADVCVIGLGGSGLTALVELQSRGVHAVGLEAGVIAGGAAGRNGGFVLAGLARPHHEVAAQLGRERAAQLYRLTLDEIDRMLVATRDAVRRTGSLRIEETPDGLADCARQREALRSDGFHVEEYEGPEGYGLLFPDDGVMQPVRRCLSLAAGLTGLHERSPVRRISPGLVETEHGRVRCQTVLVLVDGGLSRLLPEVPVRTVRLQMLATEAVHPRTQRPVYLRDGYDYYQQLPDGRLAVGGCRDVGGPAEEVDQPDPTPVVQQAIERFLRDRLQVDVAITHRWAASVGYTDDALPFVGQVRPGVWAAGGYCGTGNVVGALCGRALALQSVGEDGRAYWPLL